MANYHVRAVARRCACLMALVLIMALFWRPSGVLAANDLIIGVPAGYASGREAVIDWEQRYLVDGSGNPLPVADQKPDLTSSDGSADFVSIRINQDTMLINESLGQAMAVYEIDAWQSGTLVYSDVAGIEIAAGRVSQEIIGRIPAGCDIKIKLLYSGPAYSLHSKQLYELDWESVAGGNEVTAGFTLVYNGENRSGNGIVNPFSITSGGDTGYELPATGGSGTAAVLYTGAALLVLSVTMLYCRRCRKGGRLDG